MVFEKSLNHGISIGSPVPSADTATPSGPAVPEHRTVDGEDVMPGLGVKFDAAVQEAGVHRDGRRNRPDAAGEEREAGEQGCSGGERSIVCLFVLDRSMHYTV